MDRGEEKNMSMMQSLSLEELEQINGGAADPIVEYTVTWEDASGNKYSYTVRNGQPVLPDPIISQTVTWQDGSGTTHSTTVNN